MSYKGKFILVEGISGSGKTTLAKRLTEYLKERGVDALLNSEPTKKNSFGRVVRTIIEGNEVSQDALVELKADIAFLSVMIETSSRRIARISKKRREDVIQFCKKLECVWMKLDNGKELTELERQVLFIADRVIDVRTVILPALTEGKWVVQDRYDLSNFAYGGAHGVSFDELYDWHVATLGNEYLVPDITFLIAVSPRIAVNRLIKSGKPLDLHESLESLQKVRVQYAAAIEMQKAMCARTGRCLNLSSLDGSKSVDKVLEVMKSALIFSNLLKKQ